MADSSIVHGCLVEIEGKGVLIVGESGVGKTAVCVELAQGGHDFIADDAVAILVNGHEIIGSAPAVTASMAAVRGAGLRRLRPRRVSTPIALVIDLYVDRPPRPDTVPEDRLRSLPRHSVRFIGTDRVARIIESIAIGPSQTTVRSEFYG